MRVPVIVAAVFSAFISTAHAQLRIGDSTTLTFATAEEGRDVLMHRDDFVERLSPFDRAARLKTDQTVTESKYLEFVGSQVMVWEPEEREKVEEAFQAVAKRLTAMNLTLPDKIQLIKTSGKEEGQAAYTRASAIVLPTKVLAGSSASLQRLLCHELFHVLSRSSPELRERLYAAIGFEKCDEVKLPRSLEPRKLTNPDAPRNDHCIEVTVDGKLQWAVPVLYAQQDNYDPSRGGEFFNYLVFKFLLVEHERGTTTSTPLLTDGQPRLIEVAQANGFMDQIGRNTGYIIHPEEILADNFAILVIGSSAKLPSPEVSERVRSVLEKPSQVQP